ncbi:MAG TPA: hypothetical protein VKR42_13450 [Ktedonobacteraceae bacterium]|nr:hypothetical protein [Ktedonobacteraceae bacterium]
MSMFEMLRELGVARGEGDAAWGRRWRVEREMATTRVRHYNDDTHSLGAPRRHAVSSL